MKLRGELTAQINSEFLNTLNAQYAPPRLPKSMDTENLESLWDQAWTQISAQQAKKLQKSQDLSEKLAIIEQLGMRYQFFLKHFLIESESGLRIQEKSPEERKKGVVYTPPDISNFIVRWVTEYYKKSLGGSNPSFKRGVSVADIACGTGQFAWAWWQHQKDQRDPLKFIFSGFDVDPQAIEVCQLIDEPSFKFIQGDSLFLSELEGDCIFDIIIGNPPYVKSSAIPDGYWASLKQNYDSAYTKFDISVVFIEKAIRLLRPGGLMGLIVSNKWLVSKYGKKIRGIILNTAHILSIVDISQIKVFEEASTYPIILFLQKNNANVNSGDEKLERAMPMLRKPREIQIYKPESADDVNKIGTAGLPPQLIPQSFYQRSPDNIFVTSISAPDLELLMHFWALDNSKYFFLNSKQSPYTLKKGIHTGNVKHKLVYADLPVKTGRPNEYKHLLTSRQKVERFKIAWQGLWVRYDPQLIQRAHLDYGSLREPWIFEANPKILIKLFGIQLQAAIDFYQYYANNSLIILVKKDQNPDFSGQGTKSVRISAAFADVEHEFFYILGILNSSLISQYYRAMFKHTHVRGDYLQFYIRDLSKIPIVIPNKTNFRLAREISHLANQLTDLHLEEMHNQDEIKALEKQLDAKVSELYM